MQMRQIIDRPWLCLTMSLFVMGEWVILFWPNLIASFNFLHQLPESVSCFGWTKPEAAHHAFFAMKAWVIVALSQALLWGAVFYSSMRCIMSLWRESEREGRWWRILKISVRLSAFILGLWFFLRPVHIWYLPCFSEHVYANYTGTLGYLAVGSAVLAMWGLENRVRSLRVEQMPEKSARQYFDIRQKLQTLLSMTSAVLVFGVIGLETRKAFVLLVSNHNFFPGSIALEGFEYTFLLALAYAPVHGSFNEAGRKIRDALAPMPTTDDSAGLLRWWRLSGDLEDLLQIRLHDWKIFGPGFPILAPLLVALLATLVKSL